MTVDIRNNFQNAEQLADVHRQLNVLLIQKAPALDAADVELAQKFVASLGEFIRLLEPLPGLPAEELRHMIVDTAAPSSIPDDLNVLEQSYARMMAYNDLLKRRYREVVFGESPPSEPRDLPL